MGAGCSPSGAVGIERLDRSGKPLRHPKALSRRSLPGPRSCWHVLDAHPFFARTLRKGWVMGFIDAPWTRLIDQFSSGSMSSRNSSIWTPLPLVAFGISREQAISSVRSPWPPEPLQRSYGRILYAQIPLMRHISNKRSCSGSGISVPRILKCSLTGTHLFTSTFKVPLQRSSPVALRYAAQKSHRVRRCWKCPHP